MNVRDYNRSAWDAQVDKGNEWTLPVSSEQIERARGGEWSVVLTPVKPVPKSWFPTSLDGVDLLGLASAGGQQCPLFAAAGAKVTVIDNSPAQLGQDRRVAERDGLTLETVEGDMANLVGIADESFDLIFHPCSNCFVPDVLPVWREAFRVLRPGGVLLAGICNPLMYLFDYKPYERGELVVRHRLPYSDMHSISEEERQALLEAHEPLSFGHTLTDQIGGQLDAGFQLSGFYEDGWPAEANDALTPFTDSFIATRAVKP